MTAFAFGLAALTLVGLPPSGGFMGKWLLIRAAIDAGQWVWVALMLAGGLVAAAYLLRVLQQFFVEGDEAPTGRHASERSLGWAALGLAIVSLAVGLGAYGPLTLIDVGAPDLVVEATR